MTEAELGAKIKAKYPQYSGLSDAEVGKRAAIKYPEYRAVLNVVGEQPADVARKTFGEKLSNTIQDIFPGKKVGEAIGTLVGYATSKNKEFYDTTAPKPLEVVGDVAAGAAQIAGLKVPISGSVAKTATQVGGLSAVSGAGKSLSDGNTIKTAAKDAFLSGLTGAAVGGIAGAVSKGVSKITKNAPEALYNNALKVSKRIKTAEKSPANFLKDSGVWGNLGTFKKAATEGIETESAVISEKLKNISGGTTYSDIKKIATEKLSKDLSGVYSKAEISRFIDKVPLAGLKNSKGIVDWVTVNNVRSQLGGLIGDIRWLQSNPSQNTKAAQAVYGALADTIKKASGTTDEFYRLSQWIRTNKLVDDAIKSADSKFKLGLFDVLGGGLGYVSGDTTEEKIRNAAIGIGIERLATSPAFQTKLAQVLSNIDNLQTDTAGKVSKTVITQLIGELFSGQEEIQQ